MRVSFLLSTMVAGALLASAGVVRAAVELVQNGGFETTSYGTRSHSFGTASGIPAAAQGVSNWTGNGGYNILWHPTTSSAPANNVSGYGVTYDKNNTSTTVLGGSLEPITQFGSQTELLSQGCGISGSCGANRFALSPTNGNTPNTGPITATSGANFVMLDADVNFRGGISQTIAAGGLITGRWYTLSFWWTATELQNALLDSPCTSPSPLIANPTCLHVAVQSSIAGNTFTTTEIVQTISHTFDPWRQVTQTFRYTGANNTQQILSFLALGGPSGKPPVALLDGVSLLDTPEPATLALLSVGLAGIMVARRPARRRMVAQAA